MRVTSPVEPALDPRLGPLTFWRSQCGPIPVGQSSLLCGRHPHLSPPDPQITADLLSNGIDVYPQKEFDEDPEDRLVNEKFRVSALAVPGGPSVPARGHGRVFRTAPVGLGKRVGWP